MLIGNAPQISRTVPSGYAFIMASAASRPPSVLL